MYIIKALRFFLVKIDQMPKVMIGRKLTEILKVNVEFRMPNYDFS